jgi:hypothetical protein
MGTERSHEAGYDNKEGEHTLLATRIPILGDSTLNQATTTSFYILSNLLLQSKLAQVVTCLIPHLSIPAGQRKVRFCTVAGPYRATVTAGT